MLTLLPEWTTKLPPTTRTRCPLQFGRLHRTRDPKVPTPLWRHSHLGGDTSAGDLSLCRTSAPIAHLCSDPSSCLRKSGLRWRDRGAGQALVLPKACFRLSAPLPKNCPFPEGLLFGSGQASGAPGVFGVLRSEFSDFTGEVSEDSSPPVTLPGE
eukprot:6456236-Amphidinium_carterae.1